MKKNKILCIFISIHLTVALIALCSTATFAQQATKPKTQVITLKAVSFLPKTIKSLTYFGKYIEKVNKRAGGELKINWVGGPEVIAAFDQGQAVKDGNVDLSAGAANYYSSIFPHGLVMDVSPFTPMEERANGVYEMWRDHYERNMNVYYLGRLDTRGFYMFTKFKLAKPKDISGRKIYAFPAIQAWLKALGAAPTSLAAAEQYTALEQGLVDGGVIPATNVMSWGMHEVLDYIVDHEIYPASGITLTMNLKKFNNLPGHLQALMRDVAIENEKEMIDWFNNENKTAKKKLIDAGLKPITFSAEDAKYYVNLAVEARWSDYKNRVSADVYHKAAEMLNYRK